MLIENTILTLVYNYNNQNILLPIKKKIQGVKIIRMKALQKNAQKSPEKCYYIMKVEKFIAVYLRSIYVVHLLYREAVTIYQHTINLKLFTLHIHVQLSIYESLYYRRFLFSFHFSSV